MWRTAAVADTRPADQSGGLVRSPAPRRVGSTSPRDGLVLALALGACGLLLPACGKPGAGAIVDLNGNPAIADLSPELARSSVNDDGEIWESAPWTGTPWIAYSPRTQLHISHPLGFTPRAVLVYISFVDAGTTPALAAGDLARIVQVSDTDVTVWNDTNGTYFARVVIF